MSRDEAMLTAAECAARTGLTVRALRVYEEYGLIAPQRTASGWRCYGKAELIRLNQWRIVLNAKGNIENAAVHPTDARLFGSMFGEANARESPSPAQRLASASEAALRRFVDGAREGAPNFAEMTPALAQSMRVQQHQLQTLNQRLGKIVAIEYRGSITETYDLFDVQHERGTMRRRISLTPEGAIASVSAILTGSGLTAGP